MTNAVAGAWHVRPELTARAPFAGMSALAGAAAGDPHFFSNPELAASAAWGSLALVGDLCLDNGAELAAELECDPAVSADHAATILAAYRRWGLDCFARIDGDFALAIWDAGERRLVLARDALGQRPLHYRQLGRGIVFASQALDLAALAGPPRADLAQLAARLASMPHLGPRSFIEGVNRVQPGHFVVVRPGHIAEESRWWTPDLAPLRIPHEEARSAVSAQLGSTVGAMLRGGGTVAADLSGGLDSSLVVVAAADGIAAKDRLLALTGVAAGPVDRPPRLFQDEAPRAAQTAAINGVRHVVVDSPPESPFAALDRWLPSVQEPIPNPCNLGWIDSCFAAARDCGAATYLTGGRGNLTVTRPGMARLNQLAGSGRLLDLARELKSYRRFAGGGWPGLLAMAFGEFLPAPVWNAIAPRAYRRESLAETASAMFLRDAPPVRHAIDLLMAEQVTDLAALFADESPAARWLAIRSSDNGAVNLSVRSRFGLQLREPLIARPLVELCQRLPAETFFRVGRPRALARELLEGRAPDSVVAESARGWQGANWRAGAEPARDEMAAEIERIAEDPDLAALLDIDRLRATLRAWPRDGWDRWDQILLYRNSLLPAIGAARFARFVRERGAA